MANRQTFAKREGLDDVGSLVLPVQWRMDARNARSRELGERPWHDEKLYLPLESIAVDPTRVLYWDSDPERENSTKRVGHMLACRAVPLAIAGGNTMRNIVVRLSNRETEDQIGYGYSRIALARRVLAQLQTDLDSRPGHYRSSNLHVIFRYSPPEGEALEALSRAIKEREELV